MTLRDLCEKTTNDVTVKVMQNGTLVAEFLRSTYESVVEVVLTANVTSVTFVFSNLSGSHILVTLEDAGN